MFGVLLLSSCDDSPEREARKAVGPLIEQARTADERATLEKARDEASAEMRRQVRALDEEIRRLRKENAALEKELAE
ncbi:MAG: hypothetical protein IH848_08960 [Acidobacteria bacterium]|nr:hypothetical protein [Acidobacteriota bacterium]